MGRCQRNLASFPRRHQPRGASCPALQDSKRREDASAQDSKRKGGGNLDEQRKNERLEEEWRR
eukprot:5465-Rhodomonas_salina.1